MGWLALDLAKNFQLEPGSHERQAWYWRHDLQGFWQAGGFIHKTQQAVDWVLTKQVCKNLNRQVTAVFEYLEEDRIHQAETAGTRWDGERMLVLFQRAHNRGRVVLDAQERITAGGFHHAAAGADVQNVHTSAAWKGLVCHRDAGFFGGNNLEAGCVDLLSDVRAERLFVCLGRQQARGK